MWCLVTDVLDWTQCCTGKSKRRREKKTKVIEGSRVISAINDASVSSGNLKAETCKTVQSLSPDENIYISTPPAVLLI